jgi:hypothetical protein
LRVRSAVAPVANLAKQQGSSLSSTTCELLLRCGGATARKKLPRSVTVAGLRLLCARLFKLAPDQIQLLLVGPAAGGDPQQQQEEEQEEDIGQDDTKQLSYWDVVDGSTVRVLAVDPEQQRQQRDAEQAARQVEHERRMAQQLQEGEALRSAAAAAAQ